MFPIPVHENLNINPPGRQGAGGKESLVSVAASAGCDSKKTRLVVAHHPRASPSTYPSPNSIWGHAEAWRAWEGPQVSQGNLELHSGLTSGGKHNEMLSTGWPPSGNEMVKWEECCMWRTERKTLHLHLQAGNDEMMVIRVWGGANTKQAEITLLVSYLCHMKWVYVVLEELLKDVLN